MKFGLITAAAIVSFASAPAYATTVLTFDTIPGMSNAPGSPVPFASQLSSQFLASNGVSFSSGGGFAAVVDHFPDPAATPTPPNVIGGTNADGNLDYSAPITAAFFSTANTSVKATTNFVRVLGDHFPLNSGTVTLQAYDVSGNLLGTATAPDSGDFGTGVDLSLTFAGIHSVRFFSDNRTVAFDNFEFGDLSAVPEPATWAMIILGFGMAGMSMRRRTVRARVQFS